MIVRRNAVAFYDRPEKIIIKQLIALRGRGAVGDARAEQANLRAITPLIVRRSLPWRDPADRELLLSCLRLAAGEET